MRPRPTGSSRERLAKNEVIFRTVNEAIEQKALQMGGLDEYEFICECSKADCFERISLTLSQYEHIRREGVRLSSRPAMRTSRSSWSSAQGARIRSLRRTAAPGSLLSLPIRETGISDTASAALALALDHDEGKGMTAEEAEELDPSSDSAAEVAALEHEVQLLHEIRDGLASQPGSDAMVGAVTGLIEERQVALDRSRHPRE